MRVNDILYFYLHTDGFHTAVAGRNTVDTILIEKKPEELLDHWCRHGGSTLEGRTKAFRKTLGYVQKTPILVSELTGLIFFPTHGRDHKGKVWINAREIVMMKDIGDLRTEITFSNGRREIFNADRRSLLAQKNRCREMLNYLRDAQWLEELTEDK